MDAKVQVKHNIGNTIIIPNSIRTLARTFLGNNYSGSATSILVDNTSDFSADQILLMSTVGAENAEFVTIDAVPTPTTLTIGALNFAHSRGEACQMVNYDTFVVEKSATSSGPYTSFASVRMQVTEQFSQITDPTGLATAYYRIKLLNSVTNDSSDFSDPVSADAYDPESVGAMIDNLRESFGVSVNDPIITTSFLLGALNEARNHMMDKMSGFKQSWLEKFEHPIQLLAGRNYAVLPEDYDFKYNNSKLLSVRYPRINGLSPYPLTYVDKRNWNNTAYSLKYSYTVGTTLIGKITYGTLVGTFDIGETVTGGTSGAVGKIVSDAASVLSVKEVTGTFSAAETITGSDSGATAVVSSYVPASTTLQVRDIGDFYSEGGTIFISANALGDMEMQQVRYTGIDLVNNTFKGCTGFTRDIPENTQLFAFPTFSSATYYTVWFDEVTRKGWIVFNRPIPNVMHGRNVYIDYYSHMYPVTDINTVLPEQFKNIYPYYMKYAIKYRRDSSTDITKDPDYLRFSSMLNDWIANHYIGQGPVIITTG